LVFFKFAPNKLSGKMNVLIIGSGGREHALAWKMSQSSKLSKLYIAPGNAGTAELGENINLSVNDFEGLGEVSIQKNIDIVVVGPEDPLVNGISNYFSEKEELKHIVCIGPNKTGAQLEGSKEFAKEFMKRHNIPTAGYLSVSKHNLDEGKKFLEQIKPPYVLKADGLAAGKGVLILQSLDEAKKELELMLSGKFGKASEKVVIEEFLSGIEMSTFILTDGDSYVILPEAKDYKRIGEGDTGLNTGGMGCVSPVPFAKEDFLKKVEEKVIKPTVEGLKKDNIDFVGFIFFGLMNCKGEPQVIEYNVRMGDPETEVIMPRLKSDLIELFEATGKKELYKKEVEIDTQACVTVMLVSGGYPGGYPKGKLISNLDKTSGSLIFHAGTKLDGEKVVTNGGRVISISSLGNNFNDALKASYKNVHIIDFEGKNYREDIGFDLQIYL
jgi:phosphoribosylamine---glycine ligase